MAKAKDQIEIIPAADPDARKLVYVNDDGSIGEINFKIKTIFTPAFRLAVRKFDAQYAKEEARIKRELKKKQEAVSTTEATKGLEREMEAFAAANPDATEEVKKKAQEEIASRYISEVGDEYIDAAMEINNSRYLFGCSFAVGLFQLIVDPASITPAERELVMQPFSAEPGHFWSKADIEGCVATANASFRKAFGA